MNIKVLQMLSKDIGIMVRNVALISTPLALILSADPAKAILNVNIFDDGPNLKVVVSGSLSQLGISQNSGTCGGSSGLLFTSSLFTGLCTGPDSSSPKYSISGPITIGGNAQLSQANSVSGSTFSIFLASGLGGTLINLDSSYAVGQPFLSSATYNNQSTAAQGFTVPGLVGTWTINGTSESIKVFVGPPSSPSAAVPGPLPLLGAGAAFGWSRRMRRRITIPVVTPPRA